MRFESLASSSHGNAYIASDRDTRILIECGLSHKKLQALSGFCLADMDACLVSHEHKDHSGCVRNIIAAGVPVYMSQGTADALELETVTIIQHNQQFSAGTIDIVPFQTFHDAQEPLGFLLRSRIDGDTLVFATDTVNLAYRFPGLTILAIEANYDKEILARCQKMPEKTKHRIENTHMEIDTLCAYLCGLDLSRCREIHLLHLSDATSHEWHFINKISRVVPPGVQVSACRK